MRTRVLGGQNGVKRAALWNTVREGVRRRVSSGDVGAWPVVVGLVLIGILFQSQNSNYLTARNLSNLTLQIGVLGTLAIAVVMVLLLGEIDLSIAAVSGVCAGVLGVLVANHGWNGWAAIAAALAVGAAIGLIQGSWVVFVGVPSFIVTLAGLLVWQGVLFNLLGVEGELIIGDSSVRAIASSYLTPLEGWGLAIVGLTAYAAYLWLGYRGRQRVGLEGPSLPTLLVRLALVVALTVAVVALLNSYFGVPYVVVILLALTVVFTIVTTRTAFGRHIYAIGGNAEAARRAGIHVGSVRIAVFMIASTLGALGGVLEASREFAVSTGTGGGTLLLNAIAAAVIGGTSLFGGRGQIYNALLGALVIGGVQNGLDLLGQTASTEDIATGIILALAVSIDAFSRRRASASGLR
jgi:D-xylose transport system permease protein